MKTSRTLLLLALLAGAGTAAGAETGTLTRAESLRDKPFADAKVLAPATAGARVEILARNGGWYQVRAGGKTGWVRMLSVRKQASAPAATVAGVAGVASGRTGTGKVVTTTGVRGLGGDELTAATFDEAQVALAEKQRVSRADAAAFASAGGLVTHTVANLPEPKKKK